MWWSDLGGTEFESKANCKACSLLDNFLRDMKQW